MVQLTNHNQFGQVNTEELDLYWKLDRGKQWSKTRLNRALQANNFQAESTATNKRLRELYIRSQRGLVSYEVMNLLELKLYIAQRGLPATFNQETTVASVKTQLEQADDETTFRLLDLPPELRVQIYTHYFKSFVGTRANNQTRPPITGACRLVRQESLPAFYAHCKFRLDMHNETIVSRQLSCTPQTRLFLLRTSDSQFGWIRTIDIVFHFRNLLVELFIDLGNETTPVEIHCPRIKSPSAPPVEPWEERSLLALHTYIVDISSREGDQKFRKTDLQQLLGMVRSSLAGDGYQT